MIPISEMRAMLPAARITLRKKMEAGD